MKIEYKNTFFDFLRFNISHQFKNITTQIFFILITAFIFYLEYVSDKNSENDFVVPLIIGLIVYLLMWFVQIIFNAFYLYSKKNKMLLTTHKVEIQEESLYEETPYSKAYYYWDGITKVKRIAGFIAIYITPYIAILIPQKAFSNNELEEKFFNLAKNKIK